MSKTLRRTNLVIQAEEHDEVIKQRKLMIFRRFPDGIAEVYPVFKKQDPMTDRPAPEDFLFPLATYASVSIHQYTGTNPATGLPQNKPLRKSFRIHGEENQNAPARTDRLGEINQYLQSWEVIDQLLEDPGYNVVFRLRKVDQVIEERLQKAAQNPKARAAQREVVGRMVDKSALQPETRSRKGKSLPAMKSTPSVGVDIEDIDETEIEDIEQELPAEEFES